MLSTEKCRIRVCKNRYKCSAVMYLAVYKKKLFYGIYPEAGTKNNL